MIDPYADRIQVELSPALAGAMELDESRIGDQRVGFPGRRLLGFVVERGGELTDEFQEVVGERLFAGRPVQVAVDLHVVQVKTGT